MPKTMREIELTQKRIILKDEVETIYEKTVTPFGTSAKADVPRKYIGKRVYVVVLKK
jgi:putative transposon-encoded protein